MEINTWLQIVQNPHFLFMIYVDAHGKEPFKDEH